MKPEELDAIVQRMEAEPEIYYYLQQIKLLLSGLF